MNCDHRWLTPIPVGLLAMQVAVLSALLLAAASPSRAADRRAAITAELDTLPPLVASSQTFERIGFHGYRRDPAWIVIDLGEPIEPEKVVLFPARTTAAAATGFPASFELEICSDDSFAHPVRIARWQEPEAGAGERLPFLVLEGNGAAGRYLRLLVTGFRTDPAADAEDFYRLGEIVVLAGGRNHALRRPVTATASFESSRRWEAMNLTDGFFWCLPLVGQRQSPTNGYVTPLLDDNDSRGAVWVEVDLGAARQIDAIHLVPAHPRGVADLPGYGFPTHFKVLADAATPSERLVWDESHDAFPLRPLPNPGSAPFMMVTPGLEARTIRVACDGLFRAGPGGRGPSEYVFALAELQCWRGGENLAAAGAVRSSGARRDGGWSPAALVDGFTSRHDLLGWDAWIEGLERRVSLEVEAAGIDAQVAAARDRFHRRLLVATAAAAALAIGFAVAALVMQRVRDRRAQEAFRARLARDLHDEIGASLSHLAMQSDLARHQLERHDPPTARLAGLSASARATLDDMRDVIWLLAPRAGTWGELAHRLESIAGRMLDGLRHQVAVSGTPPEGRPAADWAREVVGFLKESIANVLRHSDATQVGIAFDWGEQFELRVEDDGRGFEMAAVSSEGHHGLGNLARRAAVLGGTVTIEAALGRGTRVRLVAPFGRRSRKPRGTRSGKHPWI